MNLLGRKHSDLEKRLNGMKKRNPGLKDDKVIKKKKGHINKNIKTSRQSME